MLRLSEPNCIPTFAMLEVVFHPRLLIPPARVDCFHPYKTLLTWQCTIIRFEFLKPKQLLHHKLEHNKWTVLVPYMMPGMPKELPLTFYAGPAWIWKPPSLTGCTMSC